jgi:NDP-sugar pyrophosphorylase family protein
MKRPPVLALTAGLGTRLRPLTLGRAKAAVPVNGEPLARRISSWLARRGFEQQVFNLHHHPESITRCLGDGSDLGAVVRYSWEPLVLGSAGGPRHALPLLTDSESERFVIVNGDTLTDVDLDALLAAHENNRALVTMALIPNPAPEKYGGVIVGADGFVTGFTRRGGADPTFHFIGVQVAEARLFEELPDNVPDDTVNRFYPALIERKPDAIAAFVSQAAFRDIGTPADYLQTSLVLAASEGDHLVSAHARIHDTASVSRSVLWDGVSVGRNCRLTECVVADGVRIPDGAEYDRCAIVAAVDQAPLSSERREGELLIARLGDGRIAAGDARQTPA